MTDRNVVADRGPPLPPKLLQDLLRAAIKDGNANTAEVLIDHGARPSHRDLCDAAAHGAARLTRLIIHSGVDPAQMDDLALRLAARAGDVDTVAVLIEHGANVRADNDEAVRSAAGKDHYEVVRTLLNAGAHLAHPIPSPTGGERGPNHEGLSREMADVLRSFGDRGWDLRSNRPQPPVCRP